MYMYMYDPAYIFIIIEYIHIALDVEGLNDIISSGTVSIEGSKTKAPLALKCMAN